MFRGNIAADQPHGNSTVDYRLGGGGEGVTFYVRELSFSVSVVMCHSALTSLFEPASGKKSIPSARCLTLRIPVHYLPFANVLTTEDSSRLVVALRSVRPAGKI